ncbi:SDR family oxidoreductase [Enteractinococcus fodinae]|uniref:NAD(P)-dependent dehydrogenase (Short-subunit alcohol dehydrogenase family) n=1 Tax=Enteractinococcus fodinae TaxID=684663 RepID=A0ABU2B1D9_9MICC|nr:glucose 1-dehydrogenase [Enteractinococcus fodinae]MDR7346194.1 NAD(P)-dependent dehydrogenase (short-subunit alcohol dehydrogenase family) [Enteractinococcus fodinae]
MTQRFADQAIIITGAGSGLGQAVAERLASDGANLVLVDMNPEGLEETKELVEQANSEIKAELVTADVTKEDDVKKYVDATISAFGKIDGFFNNAGIEGKQNLTEDFGLDEFSKVIAVNLNGVFLGMQYVLKQMHKQGHGAVVNTASVGGIRGVGNQSGYAASKHGVVGLTRNSAREYGELGVRINAIAPGAIMTAMVENSLKQLDPDNPEEAGKQFVSANPMKRFGKPEEVAGLVSFLLSEDAGFINGTVIPVDGGQHAMY